MFLAALLSDLFWKAGGLMKQGVLTATKEEAS
jgi:hypothetical protein